MKKKKILISIDWFLPGTKSGGPVRSIANLIDHLGDEFEFLVITRDTDYCETKPYENIQSDTWTKLGENLSVFYISDNNLNYRFLKKLVASTVFDVAYINGIYSRFFSIIPVYLLRNFNKPVIVAARGMLNPQAFSVKPLKKKVFLSIMNLVIFYKKVSFHATNQDEAAFIRKAIKNYRDINVVPNLPRKIEGVEIKKKAKKDIVKFVSVARVAKEKGTLTTIHALSKMEKNQEIIYDIFGPIYDQAYWKACKEVIEKLNGNIEVNYKGSIAGDDVPALFQNYHFFIMPSKGENFGHSILEAFSAGTPVIISDKTPWENLKNKEIGWDCSLDSNDLNTALEEAIAMNQVTYDTWSRNAFDFAKEYCNDPKTVEASRKLFL
jgi:glycosyltransferase involved in cell wall biosynthesis